MKTQTWGSWWSFSVWTFYMFFFREEKAIPKFGDLKERKSDQLWTLVIGPHSFAANHSSFDQVCGFCAGTSLLAFFYNRSEKWLQGIQGPCGSFNLENLVKKWLQAPIPRNPWLDSDRMHAQGLRQDKIHDDRAREHLIMTAARERIKASALGEHCRTRHTKPKHEEDEPIQPSIAFREGRGGGQRLMS